MKIKSGKKYFAFWIVLTIMDRTEIYKFEINLDSSKSPYFKFFFLKIFIQMNENVKNKINISL